MKKIPVSAVVALIIGLTTLSSSIMPVQAWSNDPKANTSVCTALHGQGTLGLAMVSDGSSGAIIAWADGRGGDRADIYAQRLNSSGDAEWAAGGVAVCTELEAQYGVCIAGDGLGGAIIAWMDYRRGPSIYAQKVDSMGLAQWTTGGVAACAAGGYQKDTVIVGDGSGGAILAWRDSRSGEAWRVYAQRIDSAGVPQWPVNGVAVCPEGQDQYDVRIVTDGAGGAVITWRDYANANNDIYAQRLDSGGALQWIQDGVAVCVAPGRQKSPAMVSDSSGFVTIAWLDSRSGRDDVYAQRLNLAGSRQWTDNGVAICTAAVDPENLHITSDASSGAIAVWQESRRGDHDIYAQRVDSTGVPRWAADGLPISSAEGDQFNPDVVGDGEGGAIVVWEDGGNNNPTPDIHEEDYSGLLYDNDIYAQQIDAEGTAGWAMPGLPVSTADKGQCLPAVVSDGSGHAICAWSDGRSDGEGDVYAQSTGNIRDIDAGSDARTWIIVGTSAAAVVALAGATGSVLLWRGRRPPGGKSKRRRR